MKVVDAIEKVEKYKELETTLKRIEYILNVPDSIEMKKDVLERIKGGLFCLLREERDTIKRVLKEMSI